MSTVQVIDRNGQPLKPCHPARARQLVKGNRARVVALKPYTIQLTSPPATRDNGHHMPTETP